MGTSRPRPWPRWSPTPPASLRPTTSRRRSRTCARSRPCRTETPARRGSRHTTIWIPVYTGIRTLCFRSAFVLEGQAHASAEDDDLAFLDRHVHLHHFGHPEIAQRAGRGLHRVARRFLPRIPAGAHEFGYAVDAAARAFGHDCLLWMVRRAAANACRGD